MGLGSYGRGHHRWLVGEQGWLSQVGTELEVGQS